MIQIVRMMARMLTLKLPQIVSQKRPLMMKPTIGDHLLVEEEGAVEEVEEEEEVEEDVLLPLKEERSKLSMKSCQTMEMKTSRMSKKLRGLYLLLDPAEVRAEVEVDAEEEEVEVVIADQAKDQLSQDLNHVGKLSRRTKKCQSKGLDLVITPITRNTTSGVDLDAEAGDE